MNLKAPAVDPNFVPGPTCNLMLIGVICFVVYVLYSNLIEYLKDRE